MKKKLLALLLSAALLLVLCACGRGRKTVLFFSSGMDSAGEVYVSGVKRLGSKNELCVPRRHAGKSVTALSPHAFQGQPIERVVLTDVIRIDPEAFCGSGLREVELGKTEEIGSMAFAFCRHLESIRLPASVQSIGYGAFSECRNLTRVYFEGNPSELGDHIFINGNPLLIVFGPAGGSVEAYCRENRIMFLPIG